MGKKGIIKIRKLRNGGKHNKGKKGLMVKSEVNIVRNLQIKNLLK